MKIYKENIQQWLPHIIGLLFIAILPMFVFDQADEHIKFWKIRYFFQLIFIVMAFYVNYLVIVPRFFFTGSRIRFFIVVFVFAILLLALSQFFYQYIEIDNMRGELVKKIVSPRSKFNFHPRIINDFGLLLLVLGFSTGMGILQRLRHDENEQKEMEKSRVITELAFLKNQISPHFFFNSLNNIYALVAINADEAQKAIEKLSGLMRYLIYESDVKTVELKKEFGFTRNYIDLMQQRISSKVKLSVNIEHEIPNVEIPPLLFIPFVENAFKHGISYRENSFIEIWLKVIGDNIVFECKNSIPKEVNNGMNQKGGLGIENIKRRLTLLYGNRVQLIQSNKDKVYSIKLILPLNV